MRDRDTYFLVVAEDDIRLKHLGGLPTPALLDACNDGRAHEAWPMDWGNGDIQWRLRDDTFDATRKPADVPYTKVRAGKNPYYKDPYDTLFD